jgi:outer membrane immunogenic protein
MTAGATVKRALAAAALVSALGTLPSLAADLPRPVYKAPPPVVVVYSWTGAYIGLNAGYSWGQPTTTVTGAAPFTPSPTDFNIDAPGFIGGGQIGYNWQSNNFVYGLEADFQYSDENGSANCCSPTATANARLRWFGTARGRIGVTFSNNWLLYATGGLAYGQLARAVTQLGVYSYGDTYWDAGWTVGAGIEGVLSGRWTWKAEYLYMDLGSNSVTVTDPVAAPIGPIGVDTAWTDHVVRLGVNYRFAP